MSEKAIIATIHKDMDVRMAEGSKVLVVVPGNYGEKHSESIENVDPDKTVSTTTDPAIIRAVCCYCGYQFELLHGSLERSSAYKKSYDEQKAQMGMASGYTVWSDAE